MTIDIMILIQMVIAAFGATILYTIIGIIPGTDETSVLVPITALLVVLGVAPLVVLTFFIAAMVSLNLTDSIPTALTSIPGGVMSTPLIDSSRHLKEKGLTTTSIKKMTMGSLIGTLIAIPAALLIVLIVFLIKKYLGFDLETYVTKYNAQIFLAGSVFLALLSKKKLNSLLAIIPFALVIGFAKKLAPTMGGTPFFLSITTGPLLISLLLLLVPKLKKEATVNGNKQIFIEPDSKERINLFTILEKNEVKKSIIASLLASITFFLSPVGMTLLIGESITNNIEDETEKALVSVTSMNAISNSAYLAGIIISLLAFKFPISPAAIGPGSILFNPDSDILNITFSNSLIAILLGVTVALVITVIASLKYASKMTEIVFKFISQESVLILLLSLVVLLVFLDAGFAGLLIIFVVTFISGILNKFGVTYGVQFMAFYASPFILKMLGI